MYFSFMEQSSHISLVYQQVILCRQTQFWLVNEQSDSVSSFHKKQFRKVLNLHFVGLCATRAFRNHLFSVVYKAIGSALLKLINSLFTADERISLEFTESLMLLWTISIQFGALAFLCLNV
jgi:hypothetical protein